MQSYEIKMKVPRELPIILHKRPEEVEGDIRDTISSKSFL